MTAWRRAGALMACNLCWAAATTSLLVVNTLPLTRSESGVNLGAYPGVNLTMSALAGSLLGIFQARVARRARLWVAVCVAVVISAPAWMVVATMTALTGIWPSPGRGEPAIGPSVADLIGGLTYWGVFMGSLALGAAIMLAVDIRQRSGRHMGATDGRR